MRRWGESHAKDTCSCPCILRYTLRVLEPLSRWCIIRTFKWSAEHVRVTWGDNTLPSSTLDWPVLEFLTTDVENILLNQESSFKRLSSHVHSLERIFEYSLELLDQEFLLLELETNSRTCFRERNFLGQHVLSMSLLLNQSVHPRNFNSGCDRWCQRDLLFRSTVGLHQLWFKSFHYLLYFCPHSYLILMCHPICSIYLKYRWSSVVSVICCCLHESVTTVTDGVKHWIMLGKLIDRKDNRRHDETRNPARDLMTKSIILLKDPFIESCYDAGDRLRSLLRHESMGSSDTESSEGYSCSVDSLELQ